MAVTFPIVLVDDDSTITDILNRAAQRAFPEATFFHVSSFAEAVTYLENLEGKGPKLILLDIDLRIGVDGLEFLTLLRNHPQGRLVPVVMLSAVEDPNQVKKAYDQGASSFTRKPFNYAEWQQYVTMLRSYWFETVTIPNPRFAKDSIH